MPDTTEAVTEPRSDGPPAWEVFVRTTRSDPLTHAGSVTAPARDLAVERATTLFPDAHSVWLCPATEVVRRTDRTLGEPSDTDTDTDTVADVEVDADADADVDASPDGGTDADAITDTDRDPDPDGDADAGGPPSDRQPPAATDRRPAATGGDGA